MDGVYGPRSTADEYADRALMSPDNYLMMYQQFHDDSLFGSDDLGFHVHDDQSSPASNIVDVQLTNRRDGYDDDDDDEAEEGSAVIKSRIASHPCFPKLLDAYIDCQKVGAPAEMVCLLDEMKREKDLSKRDPVSLGIDPELDEFMETYCEILVKCKSDLSKPFDEAASFLNNIETQFLNLCYDDATLSSDEELSRGEIELQDAQTKSEDQQLKDRLLRRYGGHISSLKLEFSKKKKNGKLPKEARQTLLDWWDLHCNWPYPTEADKIALAESTGLDQKQINNWFINQRKRHWKSPENMQLTIMDNLSTAHFSPDED